MISADALEELRAICPAAKEMSEASYAYVYLPGLKLPLGCSPCQADALLCLHSRHGYQSWLMLSAPVVGKGNNWTTHHVLDRTWHACSWDRVSADLRPAQALAEHLRAFR